MKKKCICCGIEKDISEYYSHPRTADGHLNKCKECCKKQNKDNREKHLEYYREYDRNRPNKRERAKKVSEPLDVTWLCAKCHSSEMDIELVQALKEIAYAKELIEELSSSLSVVGECEEEECELLNRAEQFLKDSIE